MKAATAAIPTKTRAAPTESDNDRRLEALLWLPEVPLPESPEVALPEPLKSALESWANPILPPKSALVPKSKTEYTFFKKRSPTNQSEIEEILPLGYMAALIQYSAPVVEFATSC